MSRVNCRVFCGYFHSPLGDSVTAGIECILGSAMYLKSTGMSLKKAQSIVSIWRGVKHPMKNPVTPSKGNIFKPVIYLFHFYSCLHQLKHFPIIVKICKYLHEIWKMLLTLNRDYYQLRMNSLFAHSRQPYQAVLFLHLNKDRHLSYLILIGLKKIFRQILFIFIRMTAWLFNSSWGTHCKIKWTLEMCPASLCKFTSTMC